MKRLSVLRFLLLGAILAVLAISCSHGSSAPVSPDLTDGNKVATGATISLGMPAENGDEFVVPVEFSDADDLYAFSLRVGFDPEKLSPIGIDWGSVVGDEDATFNLLDQSGYVPLAFARFTGGDGLEGSGTLCSLRFRVLGPERSQPWIIPDPSYLVAYSTFGEHLTLEIGGEVR